MRPVFSPNLFLSLLLLGTGLGAGWWLRGALDTGPPTDPSAPAEARQYPASPPDRAHLPAWSPTLHSQAERPLARSRPEAEDALPPPDPDDADPVARFRALLAQQSFTAAMDLYRELERRSSQRTAVLKSLVLEYLEDALRARDDEALTELVDAFLSEYYDDIDVLLVLARYQLQSDYFAEAARSFQLAFAYSQTRGGGQPRVTRAFDDFVAEVDRRLAARGRWRELTGFYESLQQLGLTQPTYQLRQAELYLHHGEPRYGQDLLQRLRNNPAVAARASALLKSPDAAASARAEAEPRHRATDSIALSVSGRHFHLPLRLNDSLEVRLVIDTGASMTTLSRRTFDAIGNTTQFTELGPQVFNTAGGPSRGTIYRVDTLQLGQQVLADVAIAVLDFNLPDEVDGLLGMNVLQHFRFQVDQDRQQLHLTPRH